MLTRLEQRLGDTVRVHVPRAAAEESGEELSFGADEENPLQRYQVRGEIARGGVGVILQAEDRELGRDVAIKILQERFRKDEGVLQRFFAEAQIAGQLQHPGIVPIYEIGLSPARLPFIAMKLVRGETLARRLEREWREGQEREDPQGDAWRPLIPLFEQVCRTVAYAHARRVVHRDLKPSNVMLGAFGEVQIVDWGFAKVLDQQASEPVTTNTAEEDSLGAERVSTLREEEGAQDSMIGHAIGTPAYMPPEQAYGDVTQMDERSDVFALGAILCEILTGKALYVGSEDETPLLQSARANTQPALQRLQASGAPRELRELAAACVSSRPSERPRHAGIVAEAVRNYLDHLAQRAREAELGALRTRARAQRTLVLAIAGFVVVLLVLGAGYLIREQERLQRETLTQKIEKAMEELSVARARAESATRDSLVAWERAETAAQRAVELAEELPGEDPLAAQLETRAEEVRALHADARWLHSLRNAQLQAFERVERRNDETRLFSAEWTLRLVDQYDQAFASVFAKRGIEPASMDGRELLAQLPRDAAQEVAGALDLWASARSLLETAQQRRELLSPRLWQASRSLDPEDPWRDALRRELSSGQPDLDRLAQLASEAWEREPEPQSLGLLAHAQLQAGRIRSAIELLREACRQRPTEFLLRFQLGYLLALSPRSAQDLEEAARHLEAACGLRPDSIEAPLLLARMHFELGRFDDCVRTLRRLRQREPELKRAWPLLARGMWLAGQESEATQQLRGAHEKHPAYLPILLLLRKFENSLAGKTETFAVLEGALGRATPLPGGLGSVARVFQVLQRAETSLLDRARAAAESLRLEESAAHYAELVRQQKLDAARLFEAARVAVRAERHDLALEWLERALAAEKAELAESASGAMQVRRRLRSWLMDPVLTQLRLRQIREESKDAEAWAELWKSLRASLRPY
jgi:serine/threonine protein kinase